MMERATLRTLLKDGQRVFAPGVYDALTARLAADAGASAVYLTGYGLEASQIGAPDIGLMTLTEVATQAQRISDAVSIPLICDIDTGFGGINNVWRTIRALERAGASALQIEDQPVPKRCPAISDHRPVSRSEAVGRVQAALEARSDPETLIIARTDADEIGFDEIVERCNLFLRAGADVAMPMLLTINGTPLSSLSPDKQMAWFARLGSEIDGPLMTIDAPPGHSATDLHEAGFDIVVSPAALLDASVTAIVGVLHNLMQDGTAEPYFADHPRAIPAGLPLMKTLDLDSYADREARFLPSPGST